VAAERGLDLAQLHPRAAQLHLVVEPAEEFDLAVGPEADPVAGPVGAGARLAVPDAPGVGHEALGGEVRPSQVAAREAAPAT